MTRIDLVDKVDPIKLHKERKAMYTPNYVGVVKLSKTMYRVDNVDPIKLPKAMYKPNVVGFVKLMYVP